MRHHLKYQMRHCDISPLFSSGWIPAKSMLLQCLDIISQKGEFVTSKLIEVVPWIYTSFMQIIKDYPETSSHIQPMITGSIVSGEKFQEKVYIVMLKLNQSFKYLTP